MGISKYFTKNLEDLRVWAGYNTSLVPYSNFLASLLGPKKGKLVLDDGCGNCRFSIAIARNGAKLVTLDLSKPLLKRASKSIRQQKLQDLIYLVQADVQNLPFKEGVFDRLLCAHNLWYIPNYEATVEEMLRTLRSEGKLVADHLNLMNWHVLWSYCIYVLRRATKRNPTPVFYRTPRQILRPFAPFRTEIFSLALSRKSIIEGKKTLTPRLAIRVSR